MGFLFGLFLGSITTFLITSYLVYQEIKNKYPDFHKQLSDQNKTTKHII